MVLLAVGLALYAAIDCARTDSRSVRGLPKPVWFLVIIVVILAGPVAWLLAGRPRGRPGPKRVTGPVAPDDDPEFLRDIERRRRQQADDERLAEWEDERRDDGEAGDPAPR